MYRGKQKRYSILILLFLIISIFSPIVISTENKSIKVDNDIIFNEEQFNHFISEPNVNNLRQRSYIEADKNHNGISDNFEPKLKQLSEVGFIEENLDDYNSILLDPNLNTKKEESNTVTITSDDIPVIVSFPEEDFGLFTSFFEELGGIIKSEYSFAINGFAGRIDYTALQTFCETLRKQNIEFLLEEDGIYHADLYYTSRNMNLRPYVWDSPLFDRGDEYSSIAIIDTGIDDSHNFFIPGYSDGDSSYKIVGWQDIVNSQLSPYDDNGHGSHCGGIAAGIGGPAYDHMGRSVATAAYELYWLNTGLVLPGVYSINWARFNVENTGTIEIQVEFQDLTPLPDDTDFWAYLYYEDTVVDSYIVDTDNWIHNISYTVPSDDEFGIYSFRFDVNLVDGDDGFVMWDMIFRSEIHWPFSPLLYGSGDPWQGVAPEAQLVGIKVLDQYGSGSTSDVLNGINWAISNKNTYNITTISMSLGGGPGDTAIITAVNNAVDNGIVTVVSAGNSGPGGNYIGSPGDADNVITVAAINVDDQITSYSSQGGNSYTGYTTKPDITAPGGSFYNLQMFSADTNDNDGEGIYPSDGYLNDLMGAQGTSMSAPAVAGASNLVIEAMGGHQSWGYTALEAKTVKALLLMSATETYPLLREYSGPFSSPLLDRGGKDVHEGYGRLNVDAAIEAYTQQLTLGSYETEYLSSSLSNPFDKHALGCYVELIKGESYVFTLDVPGDADMDLHLYNGTPSTTGEPIMVAKSISANLGEDEVIAYTAEETGRYYLIAKVISGEGNVILSYPILDHDLHVSIELPENPDVYGSYVVNATVINNGLYSESNVDLYLYLDNVFVDSTTIPTLNVDQKLTLNYPWTPLHYKSYNFTAYAPPVSGESITVNNYVEEFVEVSITLTMNYTMTEGSPYSWVDASGGNELFLSDDGYEEISLPFDFKFYDETYSTIYLGANGYLSFTDTTPNDYSNDAIPSGDIENYYLIAPFWDDIDPPEGGHIYEQSFGTYWVAEWLNVQHFPGGDVIGTFEVILYQSGEIVFNYDYLDYTSGGYTCGLNYGLNTSYYNTYQGLSASTDNFSLLFSPPKFDHDLGVYLDIPSFAQPNNDYLISASVTNMGKNNESNVELFLHLNEILINSTTVSSLLVGETVIINHLWSPTEYGIYNFRASSPYSPTEPYIANNIAEKSLAVKKINIFDNMFLEYAFSLQMPIYGLSEDYTMQYYYSELLDGFFHINYYLYNESNLLDDGYWDVNSQTRLMSYSYGGLSFGSGTHTPLWTFTDISIGDFIPIAVDGEGDHIYNVTRELKANISGFGELDVWELKDLVYPDGIAFYEKNFGILLWGKFPYGGGLYICEFNLLDTNMVFYPGEFELTSNAESPDPDGRFILSWESSDRADEYSVYQFSSYITEINGSLTNLIEDTTNLTLSLRDYSDGTYYFIVEAQNNAGTILSNCIEVVVEIQTNLILILIILGTIAAIAIVTIIIVVVVRKRRK